MTNRQDFSARAREAAGALAGRGMGSPDVAFVLGSGLAGALHVQSPSLVSDFDEIPGFPGASVSGHPGRLMAGRLHDVELLVVEGRFHIYEDRGLESVGFLAAFLRAAGVKDLILTTAAGALAPHLKLGEFVVVRSHLVYPLGCRALALGCTATALACESSPLGRGSSGDGATVQRRGRHASEGEARSSRRGREALGSGSSGSARDSGASARDSGASAQDSGASAQDSGASAQDSGALLCGPAEWKRAKGGLYDPGLAAKLETACLEAGVYFQRGVLALAVGPCYETRAEARILRAAGADVVSMSAAADALAARWEGMRVGCLCCVTNSVGLWRRREANHGHVLHVAGESRARLGTALERFVALSAVKPHS